MRENEGVQVCRRYNEKEMRRELKKTSIDRESRFRPDKGELCRINKEKGRKGVQHA